jgi:hypothetical protein
VKCASEDVKLARRAVKAAVSHLTSALHSHPSFDPGLWLLTAQLRDALRDLDEPLKDHALSLYLLEQRKRRERLRPPKRARAA